MHYENLHRFVEPESQTKPHKSNNWDFKIACAPPKEMNSIEKIYHNSTGSSTGWSGGSTRVTKMKSVGLMFGSSMLCNLLDGVVGPEVTPGSVRFVMMSFIEKKVENPASTEIHVIWTKLRWV